MVSKFPKDRVGPLPNGLSLHPSDHHVSVRPGSPSSKYGIWKFKSQPRGVRFIFFGLLNGWPVLMGPCAAAAAGDTRQTEVPLVRRNFPGIKEVDNVWRKSRSYKLNMTGWKSCIFVLLLKCILWIKGAGHIFIGILGLSEDFCLVIMVLWTSFPKLDGVFCWKGCFSYGRFLVTYRS